MLFFLMLLWCDCCNVMTLSLRLLLWWWFYCAWRRLLIYCLLWLVFYHFTLWSLLSWCGCPSRPPTSFSTTTTTYLCWPCYILLPNKEFYFVCLFTMAFPSGTRWAFSLTTLHGMHLVVSTHLFLFWVVCHPSRTFLPKEFKRKPHNRLPLLPTARPYSFLPLAHGLPFLYWLGTGWWCLSLMHAPILCVSKTCLLLMRLPWPGGSSVCSIAHS